MAPGGRRRRGEAVGHAHEREDDERGRGPSKKTLWARPLHAKTVVTACTGAHSATRDAKRCLGVSPSWVGFNCGGNSMKDSMVKW